MSDKTTERGRAINWGWIVFGGDRAIGYTVVVDDKDVRRCLHADAAAELPPGSRYQLRKQYATNFGRSHGMAWYHTNLFANANVWGQKDVHDREGGFYLVGEFTTPVEEK